MWLHDDETTCADIGDLAHIDTLHDSESRYEKEMTSLDIREIDDRRHTLVLRE